jgi:sialic acid synthase SpsE
VQGVRECEAALGSPVKRRLPSEEGSFVMGRRSIFAATDIPAGAVIREEMLAILRPGTGLEPRFLDRVVGRRAAAAIRSQDPITWDKIT